MDKENDIKLQILLSALKYKILFEISDENPLSFYPGIKDGSKLNLIIKKSAQTSNESFADQPGMQLLQKDMIRVLRCYYTESESESIANEMIKGLKFKVNNVSFDDLERLATALMQDQGILA